MAKPVGLRKDQDPSGPTGYDWGLGLLKRLTGAGSIDSGLFSSAYVMLKLHEDKMVSEETFRKMAEAENVEEALKLATGSSFLDSLGTTAPVNFEEALSTELTKLMGYLETFTPKVLQELFTLEPDFHNLKLLVKLRLGQLEDNEMDSLIHPRGFLDAATIRELVAKEDFESMVKGLERYSGLIARLDPQQLDERMVDTLLDRLMLEELARIGSGLSSLLMEELVKIRTDFGNIRLFVRAMALGREPQLLSPFFLPGGRIPAEELARHYHNEKKQEEQELLFSLEQLMNVSYRHLFTIGNTTLEDKLESGIREGFGDLRESGSLFSLEKLFDNLVVWKANEAKTRLFTLDPIIAFALGKQSEIQNLRIVMTGKLNSLDPERIRSLLRECYGV